MSGGQAAASIAQQPTRPIMDSVDSYLNRVLSVIVALPPSRLSLDDADGAVLAEDVAAACPLPAFDNSAMDGYAVLAADVAAAAPSAPVILPVRDEIAAGDTRPRHLAAGTCMVIMTGALMPAGADAVVRVEWTDAGTGRVAIRRPVAAGASVRRRGGGARPGQLLLPAGTRLGPAQIGLLAAAGRDSVLARGRPRVTILSAGNELAQPGEALVPGRTWESNSFMLAAAGHADDEVRELLDELGAAAAALQAGQDGYPPVALPSGAELLTTAALDPVVAAHASAVGNGRRYRQEQAAANGQVDQAARLDAAIKAAEDRLNAVSALRAMLAPGKFPQYLTELRTKTLLGVASELFGQLSDGEFGFAADFQIITRRSGATRSPRTLSGGEADSPAPPDEARKVIVGGPPSPG